MTSQSVLSACLLPLMKDVSEALKFDRQEKNEDAYRKYLECVLRVSTGLLKSLHADGGHVFVTKDVEKMVKLGQQCMERVASIVNERLEKAPRSSSGIQTPTSLPLSSGPGPPLLRSQSTTTPTATPTNPMAREATPGRPSSTSDMMVTSPKSVPSDSMSLSSSFTRKLGPMEMAVRQNQQLLIALRKRQAQSKNKSASTNLSLTMQRKMAENFAIARAQEEALAKKMKERQLRLEEQAVRRFHTPLGLSEEEQQQRQVYKKVLEFEQENLWMMQLRRKFEESPADLDTISELITAVLRCDAHPLTAQLQQYQRDILDKISHLVEGKLDKVESIKVPLSKSVYEQSNLKQYKSTFQKVTIATRPSRTDLKLQVVDENDSSYGSWNKSSDVFDQSSEKSDSLLDAQDKSSIDSHVAKSEDDRLVADAQFVSANTGSVTDITDACKELKHDIGKAIIEGNKVKSKLEFENQKLKSLSRQATEEYEKYNQENMDDLFDEDEDDNDEGEILGEISTVSDTSCDIDDSLNSVSDNSRDKTVRDAIEEKKDEEGNSLKKNPSFDNLQEKIAQLKNEAYNRHLKGINEDILTSIEKVQVLFVIVFEQLDSVESRDQCNVLLEGYFFKPIWKLLLVLFRLANEPREIALAYVMTENQFCSPEKFAVREQLCLGTEKGSSSYPYEPVVTELVGMIHCQTMLEKLDCLVRASKQVMQCVEQYHKEKGSEAPSLGADDLLPVLCYIVVRSCLPQLVSECQAMEKFIHEGYMFGEEGYCLTSFQTAINYLISEGVANTGQ